MTTRTSNAIGVIDLEFKRGGEKGKVLQVGRTLHSGRYEVQDVLFYGGMGVILRALDTRVFDNQVLIKVIKYQASEFAFDKQRALFNIYQLRQMFRRERRILCELRTRGINNVPHVNDFFYDQNVEFQGKTYPFGRLSESEVHRFLKVEVAVQREPYLVMERILGQPVIDRMPRGSGKALSGRAMLRVVRDVLVVLSKMHQRRRRSNGSDLELIYLDLKPQNVLMDDCNRVTLIDFGGTMPVVNGKKRKEQKGALTYGYAAPELQTLFTSIDTVDRRADLYSAGAILWSMFTGEDPARRADPVDNRFPVLSADELPDGLAPGLKDLIARSLERDPERRFGSAVEMITALNKHLGDRSWS